MRLLIEPAKEGEPARGLTIRDLTQAPLVELRQAAQDVALSAAKSTDWEAYAIPEEWWAEYREQQAYENPRRAGRPARAYAIYAAMYVRAVQEQPTSPMAWLAEKLNENQESTRVRVRGARARGLLTEAAPGKPGGELTEYALELLSGRTKEEK